ncbi:shikimate dehydrogenase family protein [Formosa sp. S-31]|uniref:shikimate dehydrogenase family protein n=1 Tax=Formosa sp. S-31 TaxID=2790949 RepID=UPI003EBA257C
MKKLGLVGRNISYSFSNAYFNKKFKDLNIEDVSYQNFDIQDISEFPSILQTHPQLKGLNVTIPYKEQVIPFLSKLNKKAAKIGAVNTIKISKKGKLTGYNTDYYGFKKSLEPFIKSHHKTALILGTGGASKAVAYALKKLKIKYKFVSRTPKNNQTISYDSLDNTIIAEHKIIVNCSPVGTFPNITDCPNIPYDGIGKDHILYDLIYNPEETQFLKHGKTRQATTVNGLNMLVFQAEEAWRIWNL